MTEIYGLFDATDPLDPDRVYTSEAFARLFRTMMRDGVVHNDGAELAVAPTVPAAMSVDVGTGMALVQGRYYINDADLTLAVEAADPSYPRIDRVVVRADLVGRTVHAVVKKGTAAASPVPPPLTRTAETWELSLAQVRVDAGATSIVAAKITDERANTSLCGVAAPVYVPSTQLEVVGAVDMQGKALTGLPVPSAATDAARKGYVDAEIAGKIGGFGISQIAIDANKNWNNRSITNLHHIEVTTILPVASDETRISGFGSTPVTVPAIYMRGTVRAGGRALAEMAGWIYVNGVFRDAWGGGSAGDYGYRDIVVEGGDVISFTNVVPSSVYIKCSDAVPVLRPESPTWS